VRDAGALPLFEVNMPKFVIERDLPGAGSLSTEQLVAISQKSCSVLEEMGPKIQWVHSYVTGDKIYCIYVAPDEETIVTHARKGGFPADVVARVYQMIEPITAETLVNA
jgi:hypothetical protein